MAIFAGLIGPAGLVFTVTSAWAASDATRAVSAPPAAIPPLATSPVAAPQSRPPQKARKKRRALSPFVRLAQQTIEETAMCAESVENGNEEFSSNGIDCLHQEAGLRWAFAQRPWHNSGRWAEVAAVDFSQHLLLQPLNIAFTPFSPWLPADFSLLEEEQRLFDSLEQINTQAGQTTSNQGNPVDRHEPPFAYHLGLNRQSALVAGLGWIDDVTDTTGMAPAHGWAEGNEPATSVGAVNLILGASIDDFTLTGGYLHAVDRKNTLDGAEASGENDPTAWNSELAYRTRLLDRKATLAVGYQKSADTYSRYFPDERYTTRASILLFDTTTLSLEYYQDREANSKNDLNGDDTYGITTKFGFNF